MEFAEIKTSEGKYILAYTRADEKVSVDTPLLYSIDIHKNDIDIECLCNSTSSEALTSLHLEKDSNAPKEGIGIYYKYGDDERVLVIETAVEVVLIFYTDLSEGAQKVTVFTKCKM